MWAVVTTNSASESADASPSNPRSQLKVKFATLVDKVSCEEGSGEEAGGAGGGGRGAEGEGRGGPDGGEEAAEDEDRGEQPDHSLNDDDYPDLPDGSCFRRDKSVTRWSAGPPSPLAVDFKGAPATVLRCAQYMGSFAVAGVDQASRAEYIRNQLKQMRGTPRTKPVLLVISLAGIKVCSIDGKSVHMAHALRRISYATCDPDHFQFSFLAREPRGHLSLQYCHTFLAQSSQQAEELNSIVGNAFRMAYASQLHRRPAKAPPGAAATSSGSSSVGSSSPPPPSDAPGPPPLAASLPPPALPPHTPPRLPPAKMPAPPRAPSPAALPPEKRRNQLNQEKHGGGTPLDPPQVLNNDSNNNSNSSNINSNQLQSLSLHSRSAHRWIATGDMGRALSWVKHAPQVASPSIEMNVQIGGRELCETTSSIVQGPTKPNSISGLKLKSDVPPRVPEAAESVPEIEKDNTLHLGMMESSPSSDESNSPTEMNSYKRMTEKPPLIKRLAMMGVGFSPRGDESCPLVRPNTSPTPSPMCQMAPAISSSPGKLLPGSLSHDVAQLKGPSKRRPLSGGYVNEAVASTDGDVNAGSETSNRGVAAKVATENRNITPKNSKTEPKRFTQETSAAFDTSKSKKMQQGNLSNTLVPCSASPLSTTISASPMPNVGVTAAAASAHPEGHTLGVASIGGGADVVPLCTPPPLPERSDSLNDRSAEEGELRAAPWFQAGIPREITLEVLGQEPVGAFMVRESTSKPGCYALSLRVPKDFQQSGIAHYLIMRTNKGYKIKGFTKEFSTLTSLITHHSVMPELLPCPLSLSRYNPSFINSDSSRDFADIDSDPDYNTLADFRKMMADLNV